MKKGVFLALLLMLLAAFPALAEDVYYADASQGGSVTSDKGYLSVTCPLDADSRVTMTIRRMAHRRRIASPCLRTAVKTASRSFALRQD